MNRKESCGFLSEFMLILGFEGLSVICLIAQVSLGFKDMDSLQKLFKQKPLI
jgi:hypothetical protein